MSQVLQTKMAPVLVYHSISAPAEPMPSAIDVSPSNFATQLRWLSRWRRVVPLTETLSDRASGRQTAITFDDGFRDNLTVALPLLERFQLPMTLFVTAGFLNETGYLSEAELREVSRHPLITIGAHGLWHRHLNQMSLNDARLELKESRRVLEDLTSQTVDLLAWPFGECNEDLEKLSAECGYRAAWSVWKGTNNQHSRWRVPLGRHDNLTRFIAKTSGVYGASKARWHRYKDRREVGREEAGRPVLAS